MENQNNIWGNCGEFYVMFWENCGSGENRRQTVGKIDEKFRMKIFRKIRKI